MLENSGHINIREGYIRTLDKIKAEYHQIHKPIRIKASGHKTKKMSALGKHIILTGHKRVEKGTLIQVKFDLKYRSKHRFGAHNNLPRRRAFVGTGQVLKILETNHKKFKMLIRLLDLCPAN